MGGHLQHFFDTNNSHLNPRFVYASRRVCHPSVHHCIEPRSSYPRSHELAPHSIQSLPQSLESVPTVTHTMPVFQVVDSGEFQQIWACQGCTANFPSSPEIHLASVDWPPQPPPRTIHGVGWGNNSFPNDSECAVSDPRNPLQTHVTPDDQRRRLFYPVISGHTG